MFFWLAGQRVDAPLDKPCVCLFIKSSKTVSFPYTQVVVVTKKILNEFSFLLEKHGLAKTILQWIHKFVANTMSKNSTPYTIVSIHYVSMCRFFLVHILIFLYVWLFTVFP